MKLLIVSDSHGMADRLKSIVDQVQPEHILHCGDFCTELEELPKQSITYVEGNCDFANAPRETIWEGEDWRVFLTHGHRYQVNTTLLPLRYRGEEEQAQLICYGHTHIPFCEQNNGILIMNPGSISSPRGGFPYPSYVIADLQPAQIDIHYYRVDGQPISQLGGQFQK
ncbi:hypothetical protein SAMN05444392_101674 [Seinonella peptonophila]|uniref:Phosphoesterase n=1 Tax=Seinonella peptonophila TaxID=112248 RepID=A0A1M4TWC1_9BACL|nr:metallophosphoesterase [Seinonella peptonophila]SHE48644.1 hypothetical protein SAMN05444392_101674 [Seinonella peptonophila]